MDTGQFLALELDGLLLSPIATAAGLAVGQDVIELKRNTAGGKYVVIRMPRGRHRPGELTMTREHTGDDDVTRWLDDVRTGRSGPLSGALTVCDSQGFPIERYKLSAVVPKSLKVDTVQLTETLVVTYETMDVEA
jgi:hypothetical protein